MAQYVANTISAWASRYIKQETATQPPSVKKGEISVSEGNHKFLREISSDNHKSLAVLERVEVLAGCPSQASRIGNY